MQTFFVGNVDEDGRRLVKCAFDCLSAAVAMVKPDTMYRDVGNTITKVRPLSHMMDPSILCTCVRGSVWRLMHTLDLSIWCTCRDQASGTTDPGRRTASRSDCPLVMALLAAFVLDLSATL